MLDAPGSTVQTVLFAISAHFGALIPAFQAL